MRVLLDRTVDKSADLWERVSDWMARRPVQIILLTVAIAVITGGWVYSITVSHESETNLSQLKTVFCSGDPQLANSRSNQRRCQHLLSQLLQNPTREQAARLRDIIQEGK